MSAKRLHAAGVKGRRIRELTSVVQKRFKFPEGTVELYAEKVNNRGLCAIAQAESLRYKLLGGLAVRRWGAPATLLGKCTTPQLLRAAGALHACFFGCPPQFLPPDLQFTKPALRCSDFIFLLHSMCCSNLQADADGGTRSC